MVAFLFFLITAFKFKFIFTFSSVFFINGHPMGPKMFTFRALIPESKTNFENSPKILGPIW